MGAGGRGWGASEGSSGLPWALHLPAGAQSRAWLGDFIVSCVPRKQAPALPRAPWRGYRVLSPASVRGVSVGPRSRPQFCLERPAMLRGQGTFLCRQQPGHRGSSPAPCVFPAVLLLVLLGTSAPTRAQWLPPAPLATWLPRALGHLGVCCPRQSPPCALRTPLPIRWHCGDARLPPVAP